jgi:hypothetical protein
LEKRNWMVGRQDAGVEILRRVRRREALGEQARLRMTRKFVGR